MSTDSTLTGSSTVTPTRRMWFVVGSGVGCIAVLLIAVAIGALVLARPTSPGIAAKPTALPTLAATAPRLATPTARVPTPARPTEWLIYVGKHAPFSLQYPKEWTVTDLERANSQLVFTAPDRSAIANVVYGAASAQTADLALDAFIAGTIKPKTSDLKIISQKKNADGSATAEVEYTSADLGGPARGLIRVVIHAGANYYVMMFTTFAYRYDGSQLTAQTFVDALSIGK